MDAHGLLVDAWGRIEDPEKWCGNGPGGPCEVNCAWLALNVIYIGEHTDTDYDEYLRAEKALLLSLPPAWATTGDFPCILIGRFNDHSSTTHDDIRALYLRAIASVAPVPSLDFLASVTEPAEATT